MGTVLYRLGRSCHRHGRTVLGLWLALLALAGAGTAVSGGSLDQSFPLRTEQATQAALTGAAALPGTDSRRGADLLLQRRAPTRAEAATARIVFSLDERAEADAAAGAGAATKAGSAAKAGAAAALTDSPYRAVISRVVAALGRAPLVAHVGDPFAATSAEAAQAGLSGDGRTAYALVTYRVTSPELTAQARDALLTAAEPARAAGITVDVAGTAVAGHHPLLDTRPSGLIGAAVVLLLLTGVLLAFARTGAALATGLPLAAGLLGLVVSLGGIGLAVGLAGLGPTAAMPALAVGLATSVGCSSYVLARLRQELAAGHSGAEAAGRTLRSAGSDVILVGLFAMLTSSTLVLPRVPVLTALALSTAGAVALSVCIALTLPTALHGAGRAVGRAGHAGNAQVAHDTHRDHGVSGEHGGGSARAVVRRPLPALLGSLVVLAVLALAVPGLRLGPTDDGSAGPTSTQRRAHDRISTAFGPGFNGPLLMVIEATGGADPVAAAGRIRPTIAALTAVALVDEPQELPGTDLATMTVIPLTGPDDPATADLLRAVREHAATLAVTTGATITVTGPTAIDLDVSRRLTAAVPLCLALLGGLTVALLMLALRGVAVALLVAAGSLATAAASYGAVTAVLRWGPLADALGLRPAGSVTAVLPLLVAGLLSGLATGHLLLGLYRLRAEHPRSGHPQPGPPRSGRPHGAVAARYREESRAALAVAAVAVVVFAGLARSTDPIIRTTGLVLAFGLLVNALVVRLVTVPAALALLERGAWWHPRLPGLPGLPGSPDSSDSPRAVPAAPAAPAGETEGHHACDEGSDIPEADIPEAAGHPGGIDHTGQAAQELVRS
ncbi:putative drug exporter of the RND superfamily [Parafrankia irregularis]|uniref:Putative drug exporter of the RND superfamily n=1 Tax=Parafrankia irregularis TaxID=795642 RepID=A0A0S4QQX6_9ACTN|nr:MULTISPECIES: MMPL family transporter [Parafrankia]MBE3206242.1 MMPL family transporter [Parafrankia sp. CH37]CUU57535.1 putative drug exporter of the RND superfamily [Parafrankia irregularis]